MEETPHICQNDDSSLVIQENFKDKHSAFLIIYQNYHNII